MSRRPLSTVFLVPGFPADEEDTACLPAIQNYVAAYGAAHPSRSVHVVSFQYPYERARYPWQGVTVHAIGGRNRGGLWRPTTWARAYAAAARLSRTTRVGFVHSFWLGECTLVGRWLCRRLRVPQIASIAGQDARSANAYLRRLRLDRMIVSAGSAHAAGAYFASTGRTVDAVVPIGLDPFFLDRPPVAFGSTDRLESNVAAETPRTSAAGTPHGEETRGARPSSPNRATPPSIDGSRRVEIGASATLHANTSRRGGGDDSEWSSRDIDVLGVGSLIPLKRYDVFLEVVAQLLPSHPDLRAVIVGEGPEKASLERRIDDRALHANVRLEGQVSRQDVRSYMLRSRVLFHPSEYESQGYVFLEALASGSFVVCRDVGFVGGHPAAYRCESDDELPARLRTALLGGPPPPGRVPSVYATVEQFDALLEVCSR